MQTKRVLVLVFGATTGVTLHEFKVGQGFRLIWNQDIPWAGVPPIYIWPMYWLAGLLDQVKKMATPGTIIASAMWGADVVHINKDRDIANPELHYRSIPESFANDMMLESDIPKSEWSRLMGHVHPEFYQMVFNDAFWRVFTQRCEHLQVVPLADWITTKLSGQLGHDPVMLHNQGAAVATSKLVNRYFNHKLLSVFAPIWRIFKPNELLDLGNEVYVVPCTHDSTLARLILASTGLSWGLWTGSWYGVCHAVADNEGITPGEKTYNAKLVFEAMPGGLTAISNIGMHGPLWKALKNAHGQISYSEAAQMALERLKDTQFTFSDEMLKQKPENFVEKALDLTKNDLGLALAIMAKTIAEYSKKGLNAAASALGLANPQNIAIVGGFSKNAAILKALQLQGLNTVIPPFAGIATQAGMAAQALRLSGTAKTITEALEMIPNLALAE